MDQVPKIKNNLAVVGDVYQYLLKNGVREDEVVRELREQTGNRKRKKNIILKSNKLIQIEKHERSRMASPPDELSFLSKNL